MKTSANESIGRELFIEELNHVTGGSCPGRRVTSQAEGEESGGGGSLGTSRCIREESGSDPLLNLPAQPDPR